MSDESLLPKRAVAQYRPIRRMEGCRRCKNVFLEEDQKVNHETGVTGHNGWDWLPCTPIKGFESSLLPIESNIFPWIRNVFLNFYLNK